MNFLSFSFILFFIVVQFLYYICPGKTQVGVLLVANYVFYFWNAPAMGFYLVFSTLVSYLCARLMTYEKHKVVLLLITLVICFGQLCWFKYLPWSDGVAQPLGLSFYSFCLTAYVFDVFYGKYDSEKNLVHFFAFSSFFPSLLSGPINRADGLLPQLKQRKVFVGEIWKLGFWRFLKGYAKKFMIATPLGSVVDTVYGAQYNYGSLMWILTVVAYAIYIYADFSSYSDMAIGAARMLGINLNENFLAPYLSKDVKTFWKKWHISLTSWFREYVYFPLGGSKKGRLRTYVNIIIVFAISGVWHGSGITYVVWGLLNGIFQIVGSMTANMRTHIRERLNVSERHLLLILLQGFATFTLITITWIFFRADNIEQAVFVCKRILLILRDGPGEFVWLMNIREVCVIVIAILAMLYEDICITLKKHFEIEKTTIRYWVCCSVIIAATLLFGSYGPSFNAQDFIYFQF